MAGRLNWDEAAGEHEGLVASIVRDLGIVGAAAADARQEGLIALRKVAERYDPSRNVAFSTYCRRVVARHLIKHRKSTNMIRVPASTLDKVKSLRRDGDDAGGETGAAVERAIRARRVPLADRHRSGQDDAVERADEIEHLRKAVLKIPARPRYVLSCALGLFGEDEVPMADIAREMEIPVEVADDLFASAVRDLVLTLGGDADE